MTRSTIATLALVAGGTIGVGAHYTHRSTPAPVLVSEPVTRGSIVKVVSSTGTLQATTTVEVGSQLTGTVQTLSADFNSLVRKGQVLATLDQSTYLAALEQAKGDLAGAEADAERLRVAKSAADIALTRARDLSAAEVETAEDLETAETQSRTAEADVAAADSRIGVARAAVEMAEINLSKTVITAPIDGVVLARNVDAGQTVSANLSAPTLFVLAKDLTALEVVATVDEADAGLVAPGQPVTFRVDAYPSEAFHGSVVEERLNAATVDNVVTYATIIDAPNPDLRLKPGMTATVAIEVARRDNVLRTSSAALKFNPDAAALTRFAPTNVVPPPARSAVVWTFDGSSLAPVAVGVGLSDGVEEELVDPPFGEGTPVVTREFETGQPGAAPAASAGSPLIPTRPQGFRGVGRS
jgi:HlyD family secretion protein